MSLSDWVVRERQARIVARAEPRGIIKASCPIALAQTGMAQYLPEFLARYPSIRVLLHATNRRVDVINEGFDLMHRGESIRAVVEF